MNLMNRFTRLFRADMNAIMDNLEEPETILKQALREMGNSLFDEESKYKLTQSQIITEETSINSIQDKLEKLRLEVQLCLDADNESLARGLIKKQLIQTNLVTNQQQFVADLNRKKQRLEKSIADKKQTIEEIKQKVQLVSEKQPQTGTHNISQNQFSITAEDVEVELLRLQSLRRNDSKKRKSS